LACKNTACHAGLEAALPDGDYFLVAELTGAGLTVDRIEIPFSVRSSSSQKTIDAEVDGTRAELFTEASLREQLSRTIAENNRLRSMVINFERGANERASAVAADLHFRSEHRRKYQAVAGMPCSQLHLRESYRRILKACIPRLHHAAPIAPVRSLRRDHDALSKPFKIIEIGTRTTLLSKEAWASTVQPEILVIEGRNGPGFRAHILHHGMPRRDGATGTDAAFGDVDVEIAQTDYVAYTFDVRSIMDVILATGFADATYLMINLDSWDCQLAQQLLDFGRGALLRPDVISLPFAPQFPPQIKFNKHFDFRHERSCTSSCSLRHQHSMLHTRGYALTEANFGMASYVHTSLSFSEWHVPPQDSVVLSI
jgi:hypothetical protein